MATTFPTAPNISFDEDLGAYVQASDVKVPGLSYFSDFITQKEEDLIVKHLDCNPFDNVIHRRQQFYGERYYHTTGDLSEIQPSSEEGTSDCLDMEPFRWLIDKIYDLEKQNQVLIFGPDKDKQPTQVLVNEYVGPMGIYNHFDDDKAFGEVVVIISLVNPIWMNMTLPKVAINKCQELLASQRVLLEPRSCLIMRDDSRFKWRHGISKTKWMFLPGGKSVYRDSNYRRLSLTIRKLLDGRKRVV